MATIVRYILRIVLILFFSQNHATRTRFPCQPLFHADFRILLCLFSESCRNVQCFHGNHCLQDQNGIPHCVSCHTKCPLDIPDNSSNYICASDGRTYKSTCDLKAAICQKGQSIKKAYQGPCLGKNMCFDYHNCIT